jgi:phenylacetate-coenzyme A ligase PaaK-like adenylate-forming protein
MSDEDRRREQAARAAQHTSEYIERLGWSAERLASHRQTRLRALLSVAKERSPWHRARLAHIDCNHVTERDLASIPTMSKEDLMEHFDAVLTDPLLSRANAEAHVAAGNDGYLFGQYRVVASGGSTGRRGVFVYDWDGWITVFLGMTRFPKAATLAHGAEPPGSLRAAVVASSATHMSYAIGKTFAAGNTVNVPATSPLSEIVARLNELRPTSLTGYATMLNALARETLDGRLDIEPRLIVASSEPLLAEMRSTMVRAWRAPVLNLYATSEGATAGGCLRGSGMHLSEDLCVFEAVDSDDRAVRPGQRATKLLLTRLYNDVQPLIRYELTDEVTLLDEPCACGSKLRRVADIAGRSDDLFLYGRGISVHPQTFRSALGRHASVLEYQVRQTPRGAAVSLNVTEDIATKAIREELERELARHGVPNPIVSVACVGAFERPDSGKLKRFFPLDEGAR